MELKFNVMIKHKGLCGFGAGWDMSACTLILVSGAMYVSASGT